MSRRLWQSGGMNTKLKTEIAKVGTLNFAPQTTERPKLAAKVSLKPRRGRGRRSSVPVRAGHDGTRERPPFVRMRKIFAQLQDGRYPNRSTLAMDFGVSEKTAGRDLEFMQDRWELPIEYNPLKRGFYFAKPVDQFPGVPVTERELFALCVAHKAIEQYQGTALQQPLEVAFQKIMGGLDDDQRFTLQNVGDVLSFRAFGREDADLPLFERVTTAIRERQALQFAYRKPGEKTVEVRRVNPYHVMQFSNRWYLIGHDFERGNIRTFVLGRMREAQSLPERFEVPKDFNAKNCFDRSLGVMTGPGDYEVVIELDPWLTDVLRAHAHRAISEGRTASHDVA